jgi:TonB family protein
MMRSLGIFCAVALHAGFLLFGGIFFMKDEVDHGRMQEVELLSEAEAAEEEEKDEPEPEPTEASDELETEVEDVPSAADLMRSLEIPSVNDAPALDAASLSAIEAALNGAQGSGDFASAVDFSSGGRIGSSGRVADAGEELKEAFDLTEIDQKPRAIYQTSPQFPNTMRGKKVEGRVSVIFIVDPAGRVQNLRAQESTHPAFTQPALEAVKQWRFEPAIKGGQRVACLMRVPIRFPQG